MDDDSFLSGISNIGQAAAFGEFGKSITFCIVEATVPRVAVQFGGPGCEWHFFDVPMAHSTTIERGEGGSNALRCTEVAFAPAFAVEDTSQTVNEESTAVLDILREVENETCPTHLSRGGAFHLDVLWTTRATLSPQLHSIDANGTLHQPNLTEDTRTTVAAVTAEKGVGCHRNNSKDSDYQDEEEDEEDVHFHMPPPPPAPRFPEATSISTGDAEEGTSPSPKSFFPAMAVKLLAGSETAPADVPAAADDKAVAETHLENGREETEEVNSPHPLLSPCQFPVSTYAAGDAAADEPPVAFGASVTSIQRADDDSNLDTRTSSSHSSRRVRPPTSYRSLHIIMEVPPDNVVTRIDDPAQQEQQQYPHHHQGTRTDGRAGDAAATIDNDEAKAEAEEAQRKKEQDENGRRTFTSGSATNSPRAAKTVVVVNAEDDYHAAPPQALHNAATAAAAAAAVATAPAAASRQLDFGTSGAAPKPAPAVIVQVPTADNLFAGARSDATVAVVEVLSVRSTAGAEPGRMVSITFSVKRDVEEPALALSSTQLLSRAKAAVVAQAGTPFLVPEEMSADASLPILCELREPLIAVDGAADSPSAHDSFKPKAAAKTLLWSSAEEVKLIVPSISSSSSALTDAAVAVEFTGGSDIVRTQWRYTTVGDYRERVLNMRAAIAAASAQTAEAAASANATDALPALLPAGVGTARLQVIVGRATASASASTLALWLSQQQPQQPQAKEEERQLGATTGKTTFSRVRSSASLKKKKDAQGSSLAFQSALVDVTHADRAVLPVVYFDVNGPYSLLSLTTATATASVGAAADVAAASAYPIVFADVDTWHTARPIAEDHNSDLVVQYRFIHEHSTVALLPPVLGPHQQQKTRSRDLCELRLSLHLLPCANMNRALQPQAPAENIGARRTNTPLRSGTGHSLLPAASGRSPRSVAGAGAKGTSPFHRLALYDTVNGNALLGLSRVFSSGEASSDATILSAQSFFFSAAEAEAEAAAGAYASKSKNTSSNSSRVGEAPQQQQLHVGLLTFPNYAAAAAATHSTVQAAAYTEVAGVNFIVRPSALLAAHNSKKGKMTSNKTTASAALHFTAVGVSDAALTERTPVSLPLTRAQLNLEARRCSADTPDTAVFQLQSVRALHLPTSGNATTTTTAGGGVCTALPAMAARLWFAPSLFTEADVQSAFAEAKAGSTKTPPSDPRDWALNHRFPDIANNVNDSDIAVAEVAPALSSSSSSSQQSWTLFTSAKRLRLCVVLVPQDGAEAAPTAAAASSFLFETSALSPSASPACLNMVAATGEVAAPQVATTTVSASTGALGVIQSKLHSIRKKAWKDHGAGEDNWAAAVIAGDAAAAMRLDNYAEIDLTPSVTSACKDSTAWRVFESTVVGQVRMNHSVVLELRGLWLKVPSAPLPELSSAYQPSCRLWAIRGSFVRRGGMVEALGCGGGIDGILPSDRAVVSTLLQSSTCDVTVETHPLDYLDPSPALIAEALPGVSVDTFLRRCKPHLSSETAEEHRSKRSKSRRDAGNGSSVVRTPRNHSTCPSSAASPAPSCPAPQTQSGPPASPYDTCITTTASEAALWCGQDDSAASAQAVAQRSSTNSSFLLSVLQHTVLSSGSGKSSRVFFIFGDAYTTRTCTALYSAEHTLGRSAPLSPGAAVAPLCVMDAAQTNGVAAGRGAFLLDDSKFFGISHKKFAPVVEWFHGGLCIAPEVEAARREDGAQLWRAGLKESDLGPQQRKPNVSLAVTTITQQPPLSAVRVSAHTLTRCGTHGLFLFGGRDELYATCARAAFFWEVEQAWTPFRVVPPPLQNGPLPAARQGHSAVYRDANESVYVYGGNRSSNSGPNALELLSDVWAIRLRDGVATPVIYESHKLKHVDLARWRHAAVYHDDYMIVIGGQCLSSSSSSSSKYKSKSKLATAPCEPLLYLDLRTGTWGQRSGFGRDSRPCPRSGHAVAVVGDSVLYLHGGRDKDGCLLGDLHQLDLLTRMWTPITPNGAFNPAPRELASMAACDVAGTSCLFLVGGRTDVLHKENSLSVCMFSTATHFWRRVSLACGPASQRYAAHAVPIVLSTCSSSSGAATGTGSTGGDGGSGARQLRKRKGLPAPLGTVAAQLLLVGGVSVADDDEDQASARELEEGNSEAGSERRPTAGSCMLMLSNVPGGAAATAAASRRPRSQAPGVATQPARPPAPPPPQSRAMSARPRSALPTSSNTQRQKLRPPHPPLTRRHPQKQQQQRAATLRSRSRHMRYAVEEGNDNGEMALLSGRQRRLMPSSEVSRCVQRLSSTPPAAEDREKEGPAAAAATAGHHRRRLHGYRVQSTSQLARGEPKSAFSVLTCEEVRDQIARLYYQDLERRRANLIDLSQQVFRERYGDRSTVPPPVSGAAPAGAQREEGREEDEHDHQRARRPSHTITSLYDGEGERKKGGHQASASLTERDAQPADEHNRYGTIQSSESESAAGGTPQSPSIPRSSSSSSVSLSFSDARAESSATAPVVAEEKEGGEEEETLQSSPEQTGADEPQPSPSPQSFSPVKSSSSPAASEKELEPEPGPSAADKEEAWGDDDDFESESSESSSIHHSASEPEKKEESEASANGSSAVVSLHAEADEQHEDKPEEEGAEAAASVVSAKDEPDSPVAEKDSELSSKHELDTEEQSPQPNLSLFSSSDHAVSEHGPSNKGLEEEEVEEGEDAASAPAYPVQVNDMHAPDSEGEEAANSADSHETESDKGRKKESSRTTPPLPIAASESEGGAEEHPDEIKSEDTFEQQDEEQDKDEEDDVSALRAVEVRASASASASSSSLDKVEAIVAADDEAQEAEEKSEPESEPELAQTAAMVHMITPADLALSTLAKGEEDNEPPILAAKTAESLQQSEADEHAQDKDDAVDSSLAASTSKTLKSQSLVYPTADAVPEVETQEEEEKREESSPESWEDIATSDKSNSSSSSGGVEVAEVPAPIDAPSVDPLSSPLKSEVASDDAAMPQLPSSQPSEGFESEREVGEEEQPPSLDGEAHEEAASHHDEEKPASVQEQEQEPSDVPSSKASSELSSSLSQGDISRRLDAFINNEAASKSASLPSLKPEAHEAVEEIIDDDEAPPPPPLHSEPESPQHPPPSDDWEDIDDDSEDSARAGYAAVAAEAYAPIAADDEEAGEEKEEPLAAAESESPAPPSEDEQASYSSVDLDRGSPAASASLVNGEGVDSSADPWRELDEAPPQPAVAARADIEEEEEAKPESSADSAVPEAEEEKEEKPAFSAAPSSASSAMEVEAGVELSDNDNDNASAAAPAPEEAALSEKEDNEEADVDEKLSSVEDDSEKELEKDLSDIHESFARRDTAGLPVPEEAAPSVEEEEEEEESANADLSDKVFSFAAADSEHEPQDDWRELHEDSAERDESAAPDPVPEPEEVFPSDKDDDEADEDDKTSSSAAAAVSNHEIEDEWRELHESSVERDEARVADPAPVPVPAPDEEDIKADEGDKLSSIKDDSEQELDKDWSDIHESFAKRDGSAAPAPAPVAVPEEVVPSDKEEDKDKAEVDLSDKASSAAAADSDHEPEDEWRELHESTAEHEESAAPAPDPVQEEVSAFASAPEPSEQSDGSVKEASAAADTDKASSSSSSAAEIGDPQEAEDPSRGLYENSAMTDPQDSTQEEANDEPEDADKPHAEEVVEKVPSSVNEEEREEEDGAAAVAVADPLAGLGDDEDDSDADKDDDAADTSPTPAAEDVPSEKAESASANVAEVVSDPWRELGEISGDEAELLQQQQQASSIVFDTSKNYTADGNMHHGGSSSSSSSSLSTASTSLSTINADRSGVMDVAAPAEDEEEARSLSEKAVPEDKTAAHLEDDPWAELGDGEDEGFKPNTSNDDEEEEEPSGGGVAGKDLLDRKQGTDEAIDDDDFDF